MLSLRPIVLSLAFGICLVTGLSANAQTFTLLHLFDRDDGAQPFGDLVLMRGKLYGTTYSGGASNIGTVYSMTPTGTFKSLYSFSGQYAGPLGALHHVGKILYGVTQTGGNLDDCSPSGCGTVFSVTRKGVVSSLYSFQRQGDGAFPYGGLSGSGPLYGVTNGGGAYEEGTVFSISNDGTENIIYSFQGSPDAARPAAALIKGNGVFYGTTVLGGANNTGTVFSMTPGGVETIIYSFQGGNDGAYPNASLLLKHGILYGTTTYGGISGCTELGCGTVFSVTLGGKEKILHRFQGGNDGANPPAGLIAVRGTFYSTTSAGGGTGCGGNGCGTVFGVTKEGVETILHSFSGGSSDGAIPAAGLLNIHGTFYGTTSGAQFGQGSVFSITP